MSGHYRVQPGGSVEVLPEGDGQTVAKTTSDTRAKP
jgi:hypothetical protein